MAKRKFSTQQTRNPSGAVPRHVANLNAMAEKCGFKTSVRVGKVPPEWPVKEYDEVNDCEGVMGWARGDLVLSTWTGTKAQLLAMGILCTSYHFPQRVGWICEPHHSPYSVAGRHPALCGVIKIAGENVSLELYGGPRPDSICMAGDVQIVEYPDEIAHHGTRDALTAEGICTARELSLKRPRWTRIEGGTDDSPLCLTKKLPDGTFIHWRETEDACRRRFAENRERAARMECAAKQRESAAKESSLSPHEWQNPDEFREWLEDWLVGIVRYALSPGMTGGETRHGHRFTLDAAGVAHVLNAIETAAQGLRTVPVTVAKLVDPAKKKAARDHAASAAVDSAFQRFIGRAVGTPPNAAAGA